jgi:putative oxidoreductase
MDIGTTLIRATVGPLFVGHGTQKLFGWFGGHGIEGTGGFFESLGLRPGKRHAVAAGAAETLAGALITAGALTPLAAAAVNATMFTAVRTAHKGKGPWVTGGGWEYNAVLIATTTLLAEAGPGRLSVDAQRFPKLKGPLWAAFALGAGAAGSYLATSARFNAPAPPEPVATEPATDEKREETGRFTGPQVTSATITEATTV